MKSIITLFSFAAALFFNQKAVAQNWEAVNFGGLPETHEVKSISVVSEQVVWAVADSFYNGPTVPAGHRPVVMRTIDGGATWDYRTVAEAVDRFAWDIRGLDANTAIFTSNQFISSDDRPVFKTSDGGLTWKKIVPPNLSGGFLLHFFDAQNGLALNENRFSKTADAGETWTAVPAANLPPLLAGETVNAFTAGNFSAQFGDRVWFGTTKGRVWRTFDPGQHWSAAQVAAAAEIISSVAFTDSLRGVAVSTGTQNIIYPSAKPFGTSDGGKTWLPLPFAPMKQVAAVAAVPGATGKYLVGSLWLTNFPDPVLAFNTNHFAASAWSNQIDSFFLDCAEFISPTVGYAAGFSYKSADKDTLASGTILATNILFKWKGNLVGIDEKAVAPALRLTCSPNPTADFLQLDLEETLLENARVEIADALGRILFSKAVFEKKLDVRELPSGLYFLKITAGERVGAASFFKK